MDGNSLGKFAWHLKHQHCQTAKRTHKVCQAVLPNAQSKLMTPRSRHQLWSSMVALDFARPAMGLAPHEPHYKDGLLESCFLKAQQLCDLLRKFIVCCLMPTQSGSRCTIRTQCPSQTKINSSWRHRIEHTKLFSNDQRHMIR